MTQKFKCMLEFADGCDRTAHGLYGRYLISSIDFVNFTIFFTHFKLVYDNHGKNFIHLKCAVQDVKFNIRGALIANWFLSTSNVTQIHKYFIK